MDEPRTLAKRAEEEYSDALRLRKRKPVLFWILVAVSVVIAGSWIYDKFWGIPELKAHLAAAELNEQKVKTDLILAHTQLGPFKSFALEKYGGETGKALTQLAEDLRQFDRELKLAQRKIRTIAVTVSIDFAAKWKDGKLPNPNAGLRTGGTKAADGYFVLRGQRIEDTEFHSLAGLDLKARDPDTWRLTYNASAMSGSGIFGELPDDISSIEDFSFCTIGLNQGDVDSGVVTVKQIVLEFYVNGTLSLIGEATIGAPLELDPKNSYLKLSRPVALRPVK